MSQSLLKKIFLIQTVINAKKANTANTDEITALNIHAPTASDTTTKAPIALKNHLTMFMIKQTGF